MELEVDENTCGEHEHRQIRDRPRRVFPRSICPTIDPECLRRWLSCSPYSLVGAETERDYESPSDSDGDNIYSGWFDVDPLMHRSSGQIKTKALLDHESPVDTGGDNVYEMTVTQYEMTVTQLTRNLLLG